jgi:hypothetical protein
MVTDEAAGLRLAVARTIKGSLLRDFARATGRQRMSVIVLPRQVQVVNGRPVPEEAPDNRALAAHLKELGLLTRARSLPLLAGFVLEVTPKQLRSIASVSSVWAIHPNLRHRFRLPFPAPWRR